MQRGEPVARAGLDGLALKPAEVDVRDAPAADLLTVDYEGREHVPNPDAIRSLAERATAYVTTPVRATGYDPLGDDSLLGDLPSGVGRILVAGNGAYLDGDERRRAIAPRVEAALDRYPDDAPAPWIGTEGIERLAMAAGGAAGGVQYDLLSAHTEREVRALRRVGYDGAIGVYAPTVLTDDADVVLDALGGYVSRRGPVREALPDDAAAGGRTATDGGVADGAGDVSGGEASAGAGAGAGRPATDATATGRTREILLSAARDYGLVGTPDEVAARVASLRDAGVDHVVGYPANGLDAFR